MLSNNRKEMVCENLGGFECSEVASACDMLELGGAVSKPSHLQIKYTANQDFGTNLSSIVAVSTLSQ